MERDLDKSSSSQPSSYQFDNQTSHHANSSQTSSSLSLDSFSTPPPPPSSDLPSKRGKRVKRGYDEVDEAIIHHFQTKKPIWMRIIILDCMLQPGYRNWTDEGEP